MTEADKKEKLYIYGRQPVIEAIRSGHKIFEVWLGKDSQGSAVKTIENLCKTHQIKLNRKEKNELQKWTGSVVHQGVAARLEPVSIIDEKEIDKTLQYIPAPFILVLDQIQDPHNLGAILRSAEACGVDLIIMPVKGSAPINATVVKTSAGAVFYLRLMMTGNLPGLLEKFQMNGISTIATLPNRGQQLYEMNFLKGVAVIIGSEGEGVRKNLWPYCTHRAVIPQKGKVNSLNASVAAGIVLYEVLRQRISGKNTDNS
ncbi:MAG: 23S rRNA (guanosine(2251)-2'-O)-methyltransferase RlmB [Calditrichaceae bacterium]|nr:23S rRNA (guanosine(2251)-2'-O)-methyltransferase RlmB [Calditrichaceae bacterium]MBN2709343.1 23S rRNA (guanosine(2251)-2'-O)-methyltransferase RlmB [Calditrichaceae bacterium]RQV94675.1 MAG: 23S rRNA (guanosine(2251)-2'-O)-methyltransferase RlmB [Calditrichota bacterium]